MIRASNMDAISPALVGHRGLRGDVLLELKKAQPLTAKELADAFGVSPNAVRRHLKELEAEGLVEYDRVHRGAGAPTFAYHLSEYGESLFPTQYSQTLTDVLSYVARRNGRDAVRAFFAERFRPHADRLRVELADAPLEDRVAAVVRLLSEQGFMAAWSLETGAVRLAEHNCAVRAVAEQFPEICAAEVDFLKEVLQRDILRDSYIPDGCNACEYWIPFVGAARASPEPTDAPAEAQ